MTIVFKLPATTRGTTILHIDNCTEERSVTPARPIYACCIELASASLLGLQRCTASMTSAG